jgi:hypothetical protein
MQGAPAPAPGGLFGAATGAPTAAGPPLSFALGPGGFAPNNPPASNPTLAGGGSKKSKGKNRH